MNNIRGFGIFFMQFGWLFFGQSFSIGRKQNLSLKRTQAYEELNADDNGDGLNNFLLVE